MRKTLGDITWAPSGDSLLFTVGACDRDSSTLYSIGIDGHGRRVLAAAPAISAAWSPDGAAIAYTTCVRQPYTCALYTIDRDGQRRHLVGRYASYGGQLMWLPSGNVVVVEGIVVTAFDVTTGQRRVIARAVRDPNGCFRSPKLLAVAPNSQWVGVITDAEWYFDDCKDNPHRAVISFVSPEGSRVGSITVPLGEPDFLDSVGLAFR